MGVLNHSSIRLCGEKTVYFDPFKVEGFSADADIIFITHDHFDHFSPEDIKKIIKPETIIVVPKALKEKAKALCEDVVSTEPNESFEVRGIKCETLPAYNAGKPFHPKNARFVGYLITLGGERIYVAGDTDFIDELKNISCDTAYIPVGGTYTMNYKEAAALVNAIKPKKAVPTHYGTVAGTPEDGEKFASLVDKDINVEIELKF